MIKVWRRLRALFVWSWTLSGLLIIFGGSFVYWCVGTEPGARWTLETVAGQFDGHALGIEGSIWSGVRVQDLLIKQPEFSAHFENVQARVDWSSLSQHRLQIKDLSAQGLDIDLTKPAPPAASPAPFKTPAVPLHIVLDRLAVGKLTLRDGGELVPLNVENLAASLDLSERGARLVLASIDLDHEAMRFSTRGDIELLALSDPWPLRARLVTQASGQSPDSPLCVRHFVPSLPVVDQVKAPECSVEVESAIDGSLDSLKVVLNGRGQGVRLDANATVLPRAAFPFRQAVLGLELADGSSLNANIDWDSQTAGDVIHDHLAGSVRSKKLNLGQLAGSVIPPAVISTSMNFDIRLLNRRALSAADLDIEFSPDSRWNKQALSGVLKAKITDSSEGAAALGADSWKTLRLADITMDLHLGKNHLTANGALGDAGSQLNLNVLAPQLAAFWPGIAGGIKLQGRAGGSAAAHTADLTATYTPANSQPNDVAAAPIEIALRASGAWGGPVSAQTTGGVEPGWHGALSGLRVRRGGISATLEKSLALELLPGAAAPAWQWQIGAGAIKVSLPSQTEFVIRHKGSRGGPGRWETQGAIDRLTLSSDVVAALRTEDGNGAQQVDSRGAKADGKKNRGTGQIVFDSDWDLTFAGTLEGQAHIKRSSGDLRVPGDPGFMLGLQAMDVDVVARRAGASTSRVIANMNVVTAKMGRIAASGSALLHVSPGGAFSFNKKDPKEVTVQADVADLGWASLFLGDATDLGGSLKANLKAQSQADGAWAASGTVTGQKIRLVRLDDGVRLLDGTLAAHLEGNRFVLDSLRFPAQQRVTPKEWRTNEWLTTNPQAKGGSLTLSGAWNLFDSTGAINVDLVRYPILQRADRYAMVTGKLTVNAPLPKIVIAGSVTADAGWFDLDVLGGVPVVDNDVIVIRPGEARKTEVPADISLDLTVNLGPRFYLTGYGVNSGLLGSLRILTVDRRLTGEGELRTRGGSIDVYGQHLQLRRGTVTFQGDIANPVLNIEALRTGVSVQAGVRVAGTAKRPRIGLVSYPDVSDVEKLSWLLLGRAPDDSGGDAALLFSVGTSLFGGGEPFYRKFGLDEVSMRSGALGSTGSILPVESVVSGLDSGTSDIERKFIVLAKTLSNGITLSLEQALSQTGTVARASYRLARGLNAEISAGTVNGIALVYRVFSKR